MSTMSYTPATAIASGDLSRAGFGPVPAAAVPDPSTPQPGAYAEVRSPYLPAPAPRPRRGILRAAGCVLTLLVMAALCLGTLYLLWRFAGK